MMWKFAKLIMAIGIVLFVSGAGGRDSFGIRREEGEKGCVGTYEKTDKASEGPLKDCMEQKT